MHDVGTLVINQRFPELAEGIIRDAAGDEDLLFTLEQERLGFDHAYLGGLMIQSWRLPATLAEAIGAHHTLHRARGVGFDAAILKFADAVANFSGTGSYSEMIPPRDTSDAALLGRYGIELQCSNDELMDEVDQQFVETIYLLVG
jgi:HD-like signal output (HDOD) protein